MSMMSFTSRRAEVLTAESLGKAQVLSAFARLEATRPRMEGNHDTPDEAVKRQKSISEHQKNISETSVKHQTSVKH